MKKKTDQLTDFDKMPFGPHINMRMQFVPALHLLSLVGTPELKKHPRVAEYIERAVRQLKAEAAKERSAIRHSED